MNVHLQPISFRKYGLILICSFFVIAVIAVCMEFYFEKLYGDLTRLGSFAERDFGWHVPQPVIPAEQFKNYPLTEADILILGDSFSVSRVWQTKLIVEGLKVSTLPWRDLKIDEALPMDFGAALRAAGFKGRYVIIESVERVFQNRAQSMVKISHPIVINVAAPFPAFTQRERVSLATPNGGGWGVKTLYNTIKLSLNLPEGYLKSNATQAVKIDACQWFSHKLCNYVLFIAGDFTKQTFNAIANVLTVNKDLQQVDIQPIWLIVPDKATVYLGYGEHNEYPYQNIWQQFSKYPELIAPNLGSAFIQKSRTIKDFYLPDDTHLSTKGYLYLGEFIVSGLHKLQANQPKPFSP